MAVGTEGAPVLRPERREHAAAAAELPISESSIHSIDLDPRAAEFLEARLDWGTSPISVRELFTIVFREAEGRYPNRTAEKVTLGAMALGGARDEDHDIWLRKTIDLLERAERLGLVVINPGGFHGTEYSLMRSAEVFSLLGFPKEDGTEVLQRLQMPFDRAAAQALLDKNDFPCPFRPNLTGLDVAECMRQRIEFDALVELLELYDSDEIKPGPLERRALGEFVDRARDTGLLQFERISRDNAELKVFSVSPEGRLLINKIIDPDGELES